MAWPTPVRADEAGNAAQNKALAHEKSGRTQFQGGNWSLALVEFQMANELAPGSDYVFLMAQCEYNLAQLKAARSHYQAFLYSVSPDPDLAETARLRIETIDRRPSSVVINTLPAGANVVFTAERAGQAPIEGQAPNDFGVPHGRYRLAVTMANHKSQSLDIDIDVGDTKNLFFRLDPVPARVEIRTRPANATLYVRGNRAQNPYLQDLDPGSYEIYAEATDYEARRDVLIVGPGEQRTVNFELGYVQRSGRPELIGFWTVAGAVGAGMGVSAMFGDPTRPASASLIGAAALVGGVGGGLVSTAFLPSYVRDNIALYRISGMWIGAAEGASVALAFSPKLWAGWLGGALGLGAGTLVGTSLDAHAPNYGRVAAIQSAVVAGALAGATAVPAFNLDEARHTPISVLVGMNAGLAAGLAIAYLPDQHLYGPSWQRVALVDLAGAAGLVAGALTVTVGACIRANIRCERFPSDSPTAKGALVGGGIGLLAGWFITRNYDRRSATASPRRTDGPAALPVPTALPVQARDGRLGLVPGLAAQGRF